MARRQLLGRDAPAGGMDDNALCAQQRGSFKRALVCLDGAQPRVIVKQRKIVFAPKWRMTDIDPDPRCPATPA